MDKFSPFFLFLSFVFSLNKPLIVPNEKGGYSFYVLVINLEQQENYSGRELSNVCSEKENTRCSIHPYCTKLGEFNVLAGDLLMTDPSPETHQCHM